MSSGTETLILTALLPIIVTISIGYLSGRHHDFAWDQAGTLNKTVMLYALPLNLFSGIVVTPRSTLLDLGPLSIALIVALVLSFVIPLAIIKYVFRRDLALSTLQALAIGSPAIPFIGVSVLGVLFGPISTSLITISGFAQNLFQLPLCLVLMSIATATDSKTATATGTAVVSISTKAPSLWSHIVDAVKQPVVWAPVLAIVFVLLGVQVPTPLDKSLALLGAATGGLALFAAGIVLYAKKMAITPAVIVSVVARNLLIPAACLLVLKLIAFPIAELREVVLTMAIPTGSIAIIVAMNFKRGEQEMASTMALSVITSIITMGGFIWLTT